MIVVIKGDIVRSRKLPDPQLWLNPLKALLSYWGMEPMQWEVVWGDSFQLEIQEPRDALSVAFAIKALIKSISLPHSERTMGPIDVRLALGMGDKTFDGKRISESNGSAFVHASERFDQMSKEKLNMGFRGPYPSLDEEINLYLKLASVFMDKWSISSAVLVGYVLRNRDAIQSEIGKALGIKQNSVSGRKKRACLDELLEVDRRYRKIIS